MWKKIFSIIHYYGVLYLIWQNLTAKIDIDRLNLMEKLAFDIGEAFQLKPGVGVRTATGYGSIGELISAILPNIYVFAGMILFILLIVGGLMVIINSGKGEQEGVQTGQKAITAALVGFLIIFASYWIIQILEVITGMEIFKGGGV